MIGHDFEFHSERLIARASGALWWPARRVLSVADLHFGKAQRPALRGGAALPPYDVADTLARLEAEIAATDPISVICLGDSFDDHEAEARLTDRELSWLLRLMAGMDWVWITGNHDPGPPALGGRHLPEAQLGPLWFRHMATKAEAEVSAHFHPKARLPGGPARACFLIDGARIILPAFGVYTGGLDCSAPLLRDLMRPDARAVLTGTRARAIPMPR